MCNSSDCFFIVVGWQVYTSTHWDAKTNTTTYCHISLDGLNAEHIQMFLDWVAFTGICGHTIKDRLRHHHILTLVAWCSWCWTIRCVSSFNYFNRGQSTHTNTKSNSYVQTDSCYFREGYSLTDYIYLHLCTNNCQFGGMCLNLLNLQYLNCMSFSIQNQA